MGKRTPEEVLARLNAWLEGHIWGALYRSALWAASAEDGNAWVDHGLPASVLELRAFGAEAFSSVLTKVGGWRRRRDEVWCVVFWTDGVDTRLTVEKYGEYGDVAGT